MKAPIKKPTDAVALMQFVKENLALQTWQGRARAEVAFMAPDLGVSWPIDRNEGTRDFMVLCALDCITEAMQPGATLEKAFLAGRATENVLEEWTRVIQCSGNRRSSHFYAIADDLVARDARPTDAYTKAKVWFVKNRPNYPIPTRSAYKQHRAEERGKG